MATFVNWMNRPQKKQSNKNISRDQIKVISGEEMYRMMEKFPSKSIRISYGKKLHKKSDVPTRATHVVVPKGLKVYAWFTSYEGKPVCALIETDRRGTPSKIKIRPAIFEPELSYGTVLYGTMIRSTAGNHQYMVCDNIFQYKGRDMSHAPYTDKVVTIQRLLNEDVSSRVYSHNFISFATPCMFSDFADAMHTMTNSSLMAYAPYCIQVWKNTNSQPCGMVHAVSATDFDMGDMGDMGIERIAKIGVSTQKPKNMVVAKSIVNPVNPVNPVTRATPSRTTNLLVSCEADQDTYSYHDPRTNTRKYLCVPTFNDSVALNTIFRNYKENANLDALEESDDEDEFEDISDTKYSNVGMERIVACKYNNKLSGWVINC